MHLGMRQQKDCSRIRCRLAGLPARGALECCHAITVLDEGCEGVSQMLGAGFVVEANATGDTHQWCNQNSYFTAG